MKFVAIGGEILYTDYENKWTCDYISSLKRIIELTNKENPNILILCHATQNVDDKIKNSKILEEVFKRLGTNPLALLRKDLKDSVKYNYLVDWADAIYEDGGNTIEMLKLWKNCGFDQALQEAFITEKVLGGLSTGANCRFSLFNSNTSYGIIEAKYHLKHNKKVGLFIPDRTAIEIKDNKYRIVFDDSIYDVHYFAKYGYYEQGEFKTSIMENTKQYKSLKKILHIESK